MQNNDSVKSLGKKINYLIIIVKLIIIVIIIENKIEKFFKKINLTITIIILNYW